jgi:hypothetical protein
MRFLRKAPKYLFVLTVIGVSSVLFGWWWFTRPKPAGTPSATAPPVVDLRAGFAEKLNGKTGRLLLVDNDLYDVADGKLLIARWLEKGMPWKLTHDAATNSFTAIYPDARVRYRLDGKAIAQIPGPAALFIADDEKWGIIGKDKDLWKADFDSAEFKLGKEKQVTSLGQFAGGSFTENLVLAGEKTLIIRNQGHTLRVNLENGEVRPIGLSRWEIQNRRSPNGRYLVAVERGTFYFMDADSENVHSARIGGSTVEDFLWLGNDRCILLTGGRLLFSFDRKTKALEKIFELPQRCREISNPSPNQRYIFCGGINFAALVDLSSKALQPIAPGTGYVWLNDDTFILSRELPDTRLRGTWMQTIGKPETRIYPEPYLVGRDGWGARMDELGVVIVEPKKGLLKVPTKGSEPTTLIPLSVPVKRFLSVEQAAKP